MPNLNPQDYQAIWLSFQVATCATLLSVPLGFAMAYFLAFSRIPGKSLIDGLINLPLVLPPVVVGYLLLLGFGDRGFFAPLLRALDLRIIFTMKGAVLASMVVGFPLLVRALRIGMEEIDPRLILASRSLGARWWDCLLSVIVPLSLRPLLAGMTLMFARSLGEFGATIILAGNIPGLTQTIPLAIYDYTNTPGGDSMALTLCLVSIVLSLLVLLVSDRLALRVRKGVTR